MSKRNAFLIYVLSIVCVGRLYSAELLVGLSGSTRHHAWVDRPAELCGVEVRNKKTKGALFLSCETTANSVRFFESEAINMLIEIEPTKIGPALAEDEDVTGSALYNAASRKISEMEENDKKFRKELEASKSALFDKKAMLLHDAMYIPMPLDTVFTMYVPAAGALTGTLQELDNY